MQPGKFHAPSLFGFVPHVSPRQYPHFMHLRYSSMTPLLFGDPTCQIWMMHGAKEQKGDHCAICQSMWLPRRLCTERSPLTARFLRATFSQSLATSCVAQCMDWILRDGEPSKGEKSEKWHCVTCTRPTDLVQLHVLTGKFWTFIFERLFSLLLYSF